MLAFVECKRYGAITFGEYVELTCTFGAFEENEMLR
jgi:hypothetical protein